MNPYPAATRIRSSAQYAIVFSLVAAAISLFSLKSPGVLATALWSGSIMVWIADIFTTQPVSIPTMALLAVLSYAAYGWIAGLMLRPMPGNRLPLPVKAFILATGIMCLPLVAGIAIFLLIGGCE